MRARLEFFAVAATALIFVVLAPVFWYSVESPAPGSAAPGRAHPSMREQILPAAQHASAHIARGEMPLWSPHTWMGAPFHGVPANAAFSPARVLDLGLEPPRALAALAFAHVFLAALTMMLLCRSLEVSWAGALPGAAAYAFSGTMAGAMSLPGAAAAFAVGPLLFWSMHVFLSRSERGAIWTAGVAMGIAMLMGAPDMMMAQWLLAVLWGGGLCLFSHWPGRWQRWAGGSVCVAILALCVSGIQLIPSLVWSIGLRHPWALLDSPDLPGELPGSPLAMLLQLLQPGDSPAPPLGYVGVVGILLALPALAGRRRRIETYSFAALCAGLLTGVALDAGRDLPGLNPSLLLFLFPLPAACLVGIGAGRVLAAGKDPRAREVLWPSLALLAVWVALLFASGGTARGWVIAAAPLLLIPMLLRVRWISMLGALALTLLLFAELATTSTNYYTHPLFAAPESNPPVLERAAALTLDGRALLLTEDAPDLSARAMTMGMRTLGGLPSPMPRALSDWWQAAGTSISPPPTLEAINANPKLLASLRALDVRTIIAPSTASLGESGSDDALRLIETIGAHALYSLETPGRVQWFNTWQAADSSAVALTLLAAPEFEPMRSCVLERRTWFAAPPPPASASSSGEATPSISVTMDTPAFLEVAITSSAPGVLVFADQWAAGWSATLDGQTVPLFRANRLLKAVLVPEGEHRVAFVYRPWPLYAGTMLSTVALLLSCMGLLYEIFRRRPLL